MADKPQSPFTGLDRALLRSTKTHQADSPRPDHTAAPMTDERTSDSQPQGKQASVPDSMTASLLASDADLVEAIRKTVKVTGKEVSFIRLTLGEKQELADIVYTYKRQGKKTSENEIARIAVNYLLADYRASGELSVLAKVIDALLA